MKDIFQPQTIRELQDRVLNLNKDSEAQWGSMTVYQMLKHCSENDHMLLRGKTFKRLLIGRLFGKMALRSNIKDDAPLSKNSPTHPDLKIKGDGDVDKQKQVWLSLLNKYPEKRETDYADFVHPFFGKMNQEQIGRFAFKHIDHHLRQFGV